jgi:hypothetical protein
MAKSRKSGIYNSEMHYNRVLSSLALGVESDGDRDSQNLEFILRKIIDDGLTRFEIEVRASGYQELAWATDVASLLEIAQWFGEAAHLLEMQDKASKKSGLPQGRR